jgi:NAD(P)-dependent dehydrogenase (short-subunit alcohol dehydrogenase family)
MATPTSDGGAATAKLFSEHGWTVFAGVRNGRDVDRLALPGRLLPVQLDVTDPDSVRQAAEQVTDAVRDRGLQVLVNNAGVIVQGPLELIPLEQLRRQFEVNVYGPVTVTQAVLPLLRRACGRVVNISAPTAVPRSRSSAPSPQARRRWSRSATPSGSSWRPGTSPLC